MPRKPKRVQSQVNRFDAINQDDDQPKNLRGNFHTIQMLQRFAEIPIRNKASRDDPESMLECFQEYVELCQKYNVIMTHQAAYLAMGINRKIASAWDTGARKPNDPRYRVMIQTVKSFLDAYTEQSLVQGDIKEITGIWLQKIHGRMVEPREEDAVIEQDRQRTAEEIAEKYSDMMLEEPKEQPKYIELSAEKVAEEAQKGEE